VVLTDTVEQLMRLLPAEDREVLTLLLQEYTIPEISKQVKRSERTVSRVLERIRRRCRRLLTADDEPTYGRCPQTRFGPFAQTA